MTAAAHRGRRGAPGEKEARGDRRWRFKVSDGGSGKRWHARGDLKCHKVVIVAQYAVKYTAESGKEWRVGIIDGAKWRRLDVAHGNE